MAQNKPQPDPDDPDDPDDVVVDVLEPDEAEPGDDDVFRDPGVDEFAEDGDTGADLYAGGETKIRLAYPIMRNLVVIGPGDRACMDCGEPGHNFHARASKINGEWYGPEGPHVLDLYNLGFIANTRPAQQRAARQAANDSARNVFGELEKDAEGRVIRRPMPELGARTTAQLRREQSVAVKADPEERLRIERQMSREGSELNGRPRARRKPAEKVTA